VPAIAPTVHTNQQKGNKTMTKEPFETTTKGDRQTMEAFGYLYNGEWEYLKKLVSSLPESAVAVNIGAGAGTSGLILVEALNVEQSFTVDITKDSSPFGCLEGELNCFKAAKVDYTKHTQIHSDSKVAGKEWSGPKLDFLFVDGDHSYEGCAGDITSWLPHMKKGGIMAIHDYDAEVWPDVARAVRNELLHKGHEELGRADTVIAFRMV